jgi:hypothetical protein
MERATKGLLVGVGGVGGALAFLALTVYPFQYGPVESALLVGGLLLFALVETILDDADI